MNASHVSTQSFGTVPYMPPELLSQGRMTTKVDVYSFAILSASSVLDPCSSWQTCLAMAAMMGIMCDCQTSCTGAFVHII